MVAGFIVSSLHAQSFDLSQNGKSVGTASLSLKPMAGGFDSTSGALVSMTGLNYSFSATANVDTAYQLKNVQLTGSVNGTKATVSSQPEGQQMMVNINANGNVTRTPLAFHPLTVFLPDFDPGALQLMLYLGAAHNNRDLWALIPKQTGMLTALRISTKADEQGTLNGQTVAVHHLTVTSDLETVEVFSGVGNELLQAEWTDQAFALVRKGFRLKPPARPSAPPPQPAAQPAQQ